MRLRYQANLAVASMDEAGASLQRDGPATARSVRQDAALRSRQHDAAASAHLAETRVSITYPASVSKHGTGHAAGRVMKQLSGLQALSTGAMIAKAAGARGA